MKSFTIDKVLRSVSNCGSEIRLGTLQLCVPTLGNNDASTEKDAKAEKPVEYRTPMYLIHSQSASIPHVTPEVLKMIYPTSFNGSTSQVPPLQVSLDSTIKFLEPLKKYGKGVASFVGLPNVPVLMTAHDPLQLLRSGHNDKFGVALWSRHGRSSLTPDIFTEAVTAYHPSILQILSDYDVNVQTSGTKRLRKSFTRAEEYTSYVLDESSKKFVNKPSVFITIEAVWFEMDEELAKKTATKLLESKSSIAGVTLAGLTQQMVGVDEEKAKGKKSKEPPTVPIPKELKLEVLTKMVKILPADIPKYVPGPFDLSQIVDLVSRGVDILDSSIVTKMAEAAEAILLDEMELIASSLSPSSAKLSSNGVSNESLPVRCDPDNNSSDESPQEAVISLKHKAFFGDFRPLSGKCTCYTCRKHTRSYIHHLFACDELLGPVLLQIHNLTAMDRFYQILRGIIEDSDSEEVLQDKLQKLKATIHIQRPVIVKDSVENTISNVGTHVTIGVTA